MNMTFKAFMMKEWTLKDDSIIVGKKEIKLSSITKAEHTPLSPGNSNGVVQVFYGSGAFDFATLAYPKKQKEDGEKAAQYILATVRGEDANEKVKAYEKLKKEGFRKRCNVCGHIFCYTFEDLEENQRLAKSAVGSSVSALTGTLAGYRASGSIDLQSAENKLSRIVDYSKCPKCGSKDIADATDADIEKNKLPQGTVIQQASAAEELKKFKELLDMGVISQEEFDAKKKQLLGL